MKSWVPSVLRWSARLSALFIASVFGLIFLGEFVYPHSAAPGGWKEWTGVLLLTCVPIGMLIAWKYELTGAVVSLGALALIVWLFDIHRYEFFAVAAIPGLLYLLDWVARRQESGAGVGACPPSR